MSIDFADIDGSEVYDFRTGRLTVGEEAQLILNLAAARAADARTHAAGCHCLACELRIQDRNRRQVGIVAQPRTTAVSS